MKQLLWILLCIPSLLFAQEDPRYLAGAVPVEDGKVVFTREINIPALSEAEIYELLLSWGEENFNTEEKRVVYQNEETGEIAIVAKDYLVFSSTALALDRSIMNYRILIACKEHVCTLKMTGIRYQYNVTYKREPERYIAEEWITDDLALNKDKTKLNRISGKFRRATIDFAKTTFDSAATALSDALVADIPTEELNQISTVQTIVAPTAAQARIITEPTVTTEVTPVVTETISVAEATPVAEVTPVVTEPTPVTEATPTTEITPVVTEPSLATEQAPTAQPQTNSLEGYVAIPANNVPSTILQMLPDNDLRVSTIEATATADAQWKGTGKMSDKMICTISLSSTSAIHSTVSENDSYRLSFSQSGTDSPWIIIECRKQGETYETKDLVTWIGEITNVWIK